jgi:cytoskeletal protein CcmA (bactofilin family)
MWKKDDLTPEFEREPGTRARPEPPESVPDASHRATIGRSITIRGEVRGDEDLLIQGQVDGSVDLDQHSVTVGREGRVKANITGRLVTVEGEVEGDLQAQEQVVLHSSARVKGDITAPRVVLEDGASFRGLVDMGVSGGKAARAEAAGKDRGKDVEASEGKGRVPAGSTRTMGSDSARTFTSPGPGSAPASSSKTTTEADEDTSSAVDKAAR